MRTKSLFRFKTGVKMLKPHSLNIKHSTEGQGTFHCFIFEVPGTRVWNVTSSNRRTIEVVAFLILKKQDNALVFCFDKETPSRRAYGQTKR